MNQLLVNLNDSSFLEKLNEEFVGKTVDGANEILKDTKYHIYPALVDGARCLVVYDLCFGRINAVVDNGVITKISGIG